MGVPKEWRLKMFRQVGRGRPVEERIQILEMAKAQSNLAMPEGIKAIEQVLEELRAEQRGGRN